jgi:hypothetical protein
MEQTGMTDGLEVTDDIVSSEAGIALDQAENRLHGDSHCDTRMTAPGVCAGSLDGGR